jgi:hypothetical protein
MEHLKIEEFPMSLDVYLTLPGAKKTRGSGIFVRENGTTKEISVDEWNARNPDREPVTVQYENETTEDVFHGNITHNLNKMASQAGIYDCLWRPDEIGITEASQIIEPLRQGYRQLLDRPEHFKQFNPLNGWGDYDGFIAFVANYLAACNAYPEAKVMASR